jgi:DNA-binding MarR family transcriptional regulator
VTKPTDIRIEPGTYAHKVLMALATQSMHGQDLAQLFGVAESEVSRQMRKLKGLGLVDGTRAGRRVYWSLTGSGQQVLEETTDRERHDESLLLAVEYRIVPKANGNWALVRDTLDEGLAYSRKSQELVVGSHGECQKAWNKIRKAAEALPPALSNLS